VSALADALPLLACPHCGAELSLDGARAGAGVRCASGHAFDVARQGYLSLLAGARHPEGDSAAMVEARERFLAAGHFAPLERAVADITRDAAPRGGALVELGAGTARYLAAALDALPGRTGLALDTSAPALRRAARAHPRAAAIGADAWGVLPLRDATAAVVLCVFAPRNGAEIVRVLGPGGALVVAAPTERHLAELVATLDLVTVDPRKRDRLADQLDPHLRPEAERTVEFPLALDHAATNALVGMGPSARHAAPEELRARIAALPEPVRATASVTISVHRR
jgi:23S rRNA (guanine745-N1)-methyltransferase